VASTAIVGRFTTVSVATDGTTSVATRNYHCKIRNLSANTVNVTEKQTAPAGGVPAAGLTTTLNPAPASGPFDEVLVGPQILVNLRADTGAALVSVEEVQHPFFQTLP
jgi:hypothetical protein